MRKNPREDYKWLEEELLALEEDEETEEEPDDPRQWWEEEEDGPNPGWSVGIYEDDADFDEDAAVIALSPREKRRQELLERRQRNAEPRQKKKKKKKGIGGLIFLALAELAGIFAIIWWWIQWLT